MRTIIEILFTNSCDRNCSYCVAKSKDKSYKGSQQKNNEQGDYKLESGIINIVQLKKWLLAQKKHFENMRLVISGGEPTLLRHYTEFLDWCFGNGFKKPILYTNGANLKDLIDCRRNPKELVKVLLTHHLDSEEDATRSNVEFLKELEIEFIVKLLTKGKDMREFGNGLECDYVAEGIRQLYSENTEEALKQTLDEYPLSGNSPFRWRWNGYGNIIDRKRTPWKESVILTVDPTGMIFNCHLFDSPVGYIYEPEKELTQLQIAVCPYLDTYNPETMECKETRCEIQHYVNLFEEL